jgi:hypothetical protein
MRTRRHFQPLLDSMPTRLAPSAGGGLIAPIVLAVAVTAWHSTHVTCQPNDTDMPQSGSSTPKNPPA